MQKIFVVESDGSLSDSLKKINEFIEVYNGKIISVTPQVVSSGGNGSYLRGKWLVVADDGKDLAENNE